MSTAECQISISLSRKEKMLEKLSKRSKVDCCVMVRMLLFETGLLHAQTTQNLKI